MNPLQITPADYHARLRCNRANVFHPDSWLSKSVLWELYNSSLWRWRFHPKQFSPTDQMRWGSLIDCLTTTPELVKESVAICPFASFASLPAQEWRQRAEAEGKIVVFPDEFAAGQKAAKMLLHTHRESARIFAASASQVVIGGKVEGLKVKGLVDLAPAGETFLADLKTTSDFSKAGFERTVSRFGYHVQAGLYLALWNTCFPKDQRTGFRLLWQDSAPPYEVATTSFPQSELEEGFATAKHLIRRIKAAAEADSWPMLFDENPVEVRRPTWASIQEEERRGES